LTIGAIMFDLVSMRCLFPGETRGACEKVITDGEASGKVANIMGVVRKERKS